MPPASEIVKDIPDEGESGGAMKAAI